jgi:two-component system NarL family response regulator
VHTPTRLPEALRLTTREREIVALAATGMGDKEIGVRLGIAVGTVRTHLHRAYARNNAAGRTLLVARWLVGGVPR